jgi:hypothetical protein
MVVMTLTPPSAEEYELRRLAAGAAMTQKGRGAQATCSKDIRLSPSLVSSVLKGTYHNHQHLAMIEQWLDRQV